MCRRSILVLALLLQTLGALAQTPSTAGEQEKTGLRVLDAIIHNQHSVAWDMLDARLQEAVSRNWFSKLATRIAKMQAAGGFGSQFSQLAMRWKRDAAGQPAGFCRSYTFKDDSTYPPRFTLSVSFENTESMKIIGIELNDMIPSPSAYRPSAVQLTDMDRDMSGQEGWLVGNDSAAIDGVTLILMGNNEVMMVIKVLRDIGDGPDVVDRARIAAIPIIRYAFDHGYRQKATDFMLGYDMTLSEDIGVAFIIPGTVDMFRIQVTPGEYNAE